MIYANEPFVMHGKKRVNTVFKNGKKVLSLSCDNGLSLERLSRSDIRLIVEKENGEEDVTGQVFGVGKYDIVRATIPSMNAAMLWLNRVSWGFER